MTGKQTNRWTVLAFDRFDHRGEAYWKCQCSCGNTHSVAGYTLRKGTSQGCVKCKPVKRRGCKFQIVKNIAIFTTNGGSEFVVSSCDADNVSRHGWCLSNTGYIVAHINRRVSTLHGFLLGKSDRALIDHINGDRTDNRRENLRRVNDFQNSQNQNISTRNTSGYKGVHWNKTVQKWQANIRAYGKQYFLGYFLNREAAAIGYNEAAKETHGKYACLNPIGDTDGYRVADLLEEPDV
jgi:hypothetical protein